MSRNWGAGSVAMKNQLLDRYLKDNDCDHGIYVVGWYFCKQWNDSESIKKKQNLSSIEETGKFFNNQTLELSSGPKKIKSFVLNCTLR